MAPKSMKTTASAHLLSSTSPIAENAPLDYQEIQNDELQALQAIFWEDFQEVAAQGAWQKTTDRSFRLTIRCSEDDELWVVLLVRFSATYPRSPPGLELVESNRLHERTVSRIQNILRTRPLQLLGEAMIHHIAEDIIEALRDAAVARQQNTVPSLDEERANAQELTNQLAKQAAEAEAQRQLEAEAQKNRELERKVKEELRQENRRRSRMSLGQPPEQPAPMPEIVSFGQTAQLRMRRDVVHFSDVALSGALTNSKAVESVFLGRPLATVGPDVPVVAVKRRIVKKPKAAVIELEALLAKVAKLEHPNLLNVLTYRINSQNESTFELLLCREYADRGPLHDWLSMSDLHQNKAQQFTRDLLEGLQYLHQNSMTHGYLSARSVYITSTPTLSPKLSGFGYANVLDLKDESVPREWRVPSDLQDSNAADIWQFGVVAIQIFLGLTTTDTYDSPHTLIAEGGLSHLLGVFLNKIFSAKKTPTCFELLSAEVLRTDAPISQPGTAQPRHHVRQSSSGLASPHRRSRHNSTNHSEPLADSRYLQTFTEKRRLGKGGFGEVVEAYNKLDRNYYAVKKIKQGASNLDQALGEVVLLSRVNHPYVVRYYNVWMEEDVSGSSQENAIFSGDSSSEDDDVDFGYPSTGGLDFVSNSHTGFEFEDEFEDDNDNDDDGIIFEEDDEEEDVFDGNGTSTISTSNGSSKLRPRKSRSDSHRSSKILYIQMELCDTRTLADLIRKGITEEDCWRLIRQITDALRAIHKTGIIHRDLKPQNIFIDAGGNPKLGDFGLATITTHATSDAHNGTGSKETNGGMTNSIGTALYVAPELRTGSSVQHTNKVDMYSLGIMFFEMCQHFSTGMERVEQLLSLRKKDYILPPTFQPDGDKAHQGRLISRLVSHKPKDRPNSEEFLQELPYKIEDEATRKALAGLADPTSDYHRQMMSHLFSHDISGAQQAKAIAWDTKASAAIEKPLHVRLRNIVREKLEAIFHRHGAEETRRDFIFPSAVGTHYFTPTVLQVLDASGNLLQLPHDLIMPYARQLARQPATTRCTFTFSGAYRDSGGPPRVSVEADFDIANDEEDDTAMNDAEALKVVDEALTELPQFVAPQAAYHLSHGLLIDAILDACRVPSKYQRKVKEMLGNVGYTNSQNIPWPKVRTELRNMGLMDTTLDELQDYDWSLPPRKAFDKLATLMKTADQRIRTKCDTAIEELRRIVHFTEQFGVTRKVLITPRSCHKADFYATGFIFTAAVAEKKGKRVLAAGGRYDSLIRSQYSTQANIKQGAVGIQIGIEPIVNLLAQSGAGSKSTFLKDPRQLQQLPKRCDVVVVTNGTENVRGRAIGILKALWENDVKAELSRAHKSVDSQDYVFIAYLRHETSTTVRVAKTDTPEEAEVEVPISSLPGHILQELRDRATTKARIPLLRSHSSQHEAEDRKDNNVDVLRVDHGGRKANQYEIIQGAQRALEMSLEDKKASQILAIEARGSILDLVEKTRLSDPESWRHAIQSAQANERKYVGEIHAKLLGYRTDGTRDAFLYNFRAREGIWYNLAA
ncbi:hypothetical protein CKM354_001050700 [Cercospora kikuchii]|uniref:non-specific serine/threonine protein kinase n=1 Tax=Cercospora kikuchii TaxID=84275 RepID=A0A9P3FHC9_9PEZI|nr:serine/threonine-protein kinase GCN2 [Cercospora kikuchii]GIZ47416.1 hypothetical protein CKM354_001050700 [Cercospora kikuchii]